MCKLSIITINLNNRDGLQKTMESVSSQSYHDYEYIIIDGASTDGSVDVVSDEKIHNYFIRNGIGYKWISEKDNGIYNAMNKGICMANGEYLLFLNSGDYLVDKDVLSKVFNNDLRADIICARCDVSKNGQVVWTSPYLQSVTLQTLYFIGIPHQSTFIKKSLFEVFGEYDESYKYNADIAFWYKTIIFGGVSIQGVNIITTNYNLEGLSSISSGSEDITNENRIIQSQGCLPRILPDYEQWRSEREIVNKYSWIENHSILQRGLQLYHKVCKKLSK